MTDYLCSSLAWSVLWFLIGCAVGYLLALLREKNT